MASPTLPVDISDLRGIIQTKLTDLNPFVQAADAIVQSTLVSNPYYKSLPAAGALLYQVELWLAAHFVAIRDQRPVTQIVGEVSAHFVNKFDYDLRLTTYGQQACALDASGSLRRMGKRIASWTATSLPSNSTAGV